MTTQDDDGVSFAEIKYKMHKLFMSYCDFTDKTAFTFISHNKFLKIVEDAKIKLH